MPRTRSLLKRQVLTDCYEQDGRWWFSIGQEVTNGGWEGVELSPDEAAKVLADLKAAVEAYERTRTRSLLKPESGHC
jgi:hypothetical protein